MICYGSFRSRYGEWNLCLAFSIGPTSTFLPRVSSSCSRRWFKERMKDSLDDLKDPKGSSTNHLETQASPTGLSSEGSLLTATKVQDLPTSQSADLLPVDMPDGSSLTYPPPKSPPLPESSLPPPSQPAPDSPSTLQKEFISEAPSSTFDFQLFLDQLKTRSAEPVARYLRRQSLCLEPFHFPVNKQF